MMSLETMLVPIQSEDDNDSEEEQREEDDGHGCGQDEIEHNTGQCMATVLHEVKKYSPMAGAVYGPDVETIVHEEDSQPLTQPIIELVRKNKLETLEQELPYHRLPTSQRSWLT